MITGSVSDRGQATIVLAIEGPSGTQLERPVVIDTGFTGYLSLTRSVIEDLGLQPQTEETVMLADGSYVSLSKYIATVIWDEKPVKAVVYAVEGDALLGMALLRGYHLGIDVIENGAVTLTPLNA